MWINLDKDELELIAAHARSGMGRKGKAIADKIDEEIKSAFDPRNSEWVEKAKSCHQDEGQVEVDEQADGSAKVSDNGENGAYVLAWVFVDYVEMGIPYPVLEGEDETEDA